MYEEYRYDALGRRVWRRSQGGQSGNYVSRTVWDGDQYLYETISSTNNGSGLESDSALGKIALGCVRTDISLRLYSRAGGTKLLDWDRPPRLLWKIP